MNRFVNRSLCFLMLGAACLAQQPDWTQIKNNPLTAAKAYVDSGNAWRWNDVAVSGARLYSQMGSDGSNQVSGLGQWHSVYHTMGSDGINTHKSFVIDAHANAGTGNLLVGLHITTTADGTWAPGAEIGGITKGPMPLTLSAISYRGGSVAAGLITSNCLTGASPTNCRNVSGFEFNLNIDSGRTAGAKSGLLFVDWSEGTTTEQDQNYGMGFDVASGTAERFEYGIKFGGVANPSSRQPVKGTAIIAGAGTMVTALDFTRPTFSGDAMKFPGFTVGATGRTTIESPFDSTNGTLKLRASGSDSAILGLWVQGGAAAGSRQWMIANNYVAAGNLDFYVSSDNSAAPSAGTRVVSFTSTTIQIPSIAAASGTRYVCVNTSGTLTSSASACSGT
jgi:urease beta subunit